MLIATSRFLVVVCLLALAACGDSSTGTEAEVHSPSIQDLAGLAVSSK